MEKFKTKKLTNRNRTETKTVKNRTSSSNGSANSRHRSEWSFQQQLLDGILFPFQLYRSAELAECTDLCFCEVSLQVSCKVACVPRAPCSSRLAHYSHAAPAYQAYRGRCYCYSGSFICMRPNPGNEFRQLFLFDKLSCLRNASTYDRLITSDHCA